MNPCRTWAAAVCFVVAVWCPVGRAADQTPDDFKTGPIDCDVLKDKPDARYQTAMKAVNEGRGNPMEKLPELRERFWATYPDKPGHKEAREAFAQALYLKDMFYLQANLFIRIIEADNAELERKGEDAAMNQALSFLGVDIDGGIPKSARYCSVSTFGKFGACSVALSRQCGYTLRDDDL